MRKLQETTNKYYKFIVNLLNILYLVRSYYKILEKNTNKSYKLVVNLQIVLYLVRNYNKIQEIILIISVNVS